MPRQGFGVRRRLARPGTAGFLRVMSRTQGWPRTVTWSIASELFTEVSQPQVEFARWWSRRDGRSVAIAQRRVDYPAPAAVLDEHELIHVLKFEGCATVATSTSPCLGSLSRHGAHLHCWLRVFAGEHREFRPVTHFFDSHGHAAMMCAAVSAKRATAEHPQLRIVASNDLEDEVAKPHGRGRVGPECPEPSSARTPPFVAL